MRRWLIFISLKLITSFLVITFTEFQNIPLLPSKFRTHRRVYLNLLGFVWYTFSTLLTLWMLSIGWIIHNSWILYLIFFITHRYLSRL